MDDSLNVMDYLHNFIEKKTGSNYTVPKLYEPKEMVAGRKRVSLKKRWYVYYYFRNPKTGKKDMFKVYGKMNYINNIDERRRFAFEIVDGLKRLLDAGYNPYKKKIEAFKDSYANDVPELFNNTSSNGEPTLRKVLLDALKKKKGTVKEYTFKGYSHRVDALLNYLAKTNDDTQPVSNFSFDDALAYVNHLRSKDISPTSIDNARRELASIFQILKSDRVITENYFASIKTQKSKPKRHVAFDKKQVKELKKYMIEHEPNLYYFISVMMYCFLRNREVVNLKVGDVDLKRKVLSIETKTETVSYKLLTDNVIDILVNVYDIENKPTDHFIFTNKAGETGYWTAKANTKLKVFSDAFKSVKEHFGLGSDYTIYGFRHTIITDVFVGLLKSGLNEREAIPKLMGITGHTSETALRKYLREIGAILPEKAESYTTLDF